MAPAVYLPAEAILACSGRSCRATTTYRLPPKSGNRVSRSSIEAGLVLITRPIVAKAAADCKRGASGPLSRQSSVDSRQERVPRRRSWRPAQNSCAAHHGTARSPITRAKRALHGGNAPASREQSEQLSRVRARGRARIRPRFEVDLGGVHLGLGRGSFWTPAGSMRVNAQDKREARGEKRRLAYRDGVAGALRKTAAQPKLPRNPRLTPPLGGPSRDRQVPPHASEASASRGQRPYLTQAARALVL